MEKPRTRLVNFRVSDEEYTKIKAWTADSGARSISEFARIKVLKDPEQQTLSTRPTDSEVIRKISMEVEKIKFHLDID